MIQKFRTVFVLGGPGSGKGTQCALIEKTFKFKHLSAGQLLRDQQARSESQVGVKIEKIILDGKIVPSFITSNLLLSTMRSNQFQTRRFLIDGFPRNMQNYSYWKSSAKEMTICPFVLHFKCSQQQMIKRLLKRAQSSGRSDDKMEIIKKRLTTYYTETQAVLSQFDKETKVHHINSDVTPENIFKEVKAIFENFFIQDNSD